MQQPRLAEDTAGASREVRPLTWFRRKPKPETLPERLRWYWANYRCSTCNRVRDEGTLDESVSEIRCGLPQADGTRCEGMSRKEG